MADTKVVKAGRAFLKAGEKNYQSQEKLAELQGRFRVFAIAAKIVAQHCEPIFNEMKRRRKVEIQRIWDEANRELARIRDKWESKFGPGYPDTIDDIIREARRAGVDPKTLLDDDPDLSAIWLIIEGNRMKLKDESLAESGPIANCKPGPKPKDSIKRRDERLRRLAKEHKCVNSPATLRDIANRDRKIQSFGLPDVTYAIANNALRPLKKRGSNSAQ